MVLLVAYGALGQETGQSSGTSSFGVVIYAEGDTVSVIRDLRRTEYDAFTGELLGLPLFSGDLIQTDPDTYIEIQLLPSRSIIKVAENTSFTVEQISATGDGVFDLSYGRLRARVTRLAGAQPFEIRGVGATAGVRGTDFGTDVIVEPVGGASLTRVYSFEGDVHVQLTPTVAAVSDDADPQKLASEVIVVSANQMVTATTLSPTAAASAPIASDGVVVAEASQPEVQSISSSIVEYWDRENFVGEAQETGALLAQFPYLADDVIQRLGSLAFLNSGASANAATSDQSPSTVVEPAPQGEVDMPAEVEVPASDVPQGLDVVAVDAVGLEADPDAADPERQRRLIGATKAAGIAMTTIGLLADAAAVTGYFWGAQILPDWAPASDPDILTVVAASGGVFLIGGILSLLFSLQLSQ